MSARWLLHGLGRQLRRSRSPLGALVAAFALAAGLGSAALALGRAVGVTAERLTGEVDVVVYFEPGLGVDRERAFAQALERLDGVTAVRFIDGEAAQARLERALASFGDDPTTLPVEAELLPRSLEIALRPGSDLSDRAGELASRLRRVEGIAAVDAMTEGLGRVALWIRFGRLLAIALGVVSALAATAALLFVVARERVRRAEEAEALEALGATPAFARAPLAMLGALAALLGGLLGGLGGDRATAAAVREAVGTSVALLQPRQLAVLVVACALAGCAAGWLSLRRFRHAA